MQNKWFPTIGIKENWKVILLSIIGAATFWFFNALNKNYDARISYPLSFSFDRDSVIVVEPLAEEVKIDVTSGGWNLLRKTFWLNATPLDINLDNPSDVKYLTRASLIPIISEQLDGLKLNYVVTDTVFINIEDKVMKKLKVQVDSIRLPLEDGYRVVSPINIDPDSAIIIGPKSIMNIMNLYVWADFENTGIDRDFDDDVKLMLPNRNLVASNPDEVNITFKVEQFINDQRNVKLELLNFPEDSSAYLQDSLMTLQYLVNKSLADKISVEDFHVTVDYSMLNRKDSTIAPIITISHENALELNFDPETLKVIHEKK